MRVAVALPLLALAVGCGEHRPPTAIHRVEVTTVVPDAGANAAVEDPVAPTAGTADDLLAHVFDLAAGPAVPAAFGKLRPGMSRRDATKARPADWGQAWSTTLAGTVLRAGRDDASDDPVQRLSVELKQRDAVARLTTAWGAPGLTAFHKGTVCWLATATRLKICHSKDLDHDQLDLVTYVPFADALTRGGPRTPAAAIGHLGEAKRDLVRDFPAAVEITDPDDPTQHRLELAYPTSELTADVAPDRAVYYLDKADKVVAIHLWFGANDPAVRATVKDALDAAVAQVETDDDTMITVRDQDQAAVVVVLDRTPGLR